MLPFGFEGPIRYKTAAVTFGTAVTEKGYTSPKMQDSDNDVVADLDLSTKSFKPFGVATSIAKHGLFGFPINSTASLVYPTLPLRLNASAEGLSNTKDSFQIYA